jgi:hypothetical protein
MAQLVAHYTGDGQTGRMFFDHAMARIWTHCAVVFYLDAHHINHSL